MILQKIKFKIIKISTNAIYKGVNWKVRSNHKNDYIYLCCSAMRKMTKIDKKVDLDMEFYLTGRLLDSSNCSYMFKLIEDCMVRYKVFKDDNSKYIGKISMESFKSDTKEDYVVINIIKRAD